jgi:tetratricopeptide (TPR) repeat protein
MQPPTLSHTLTLIAAGDYALAKDLLEELLMDNPRDPDVLYNLGMCFTEMGKPDKSIKPLEQCIKHSPGHANAHVALGYSHVQLDNNDAAIEYFFAALRLEPANPHALRNLGGLYGKLGNTEKSLYYLMKAYEIDPSDPRTVYGLGYSFEMWGDMVNAGRYYLEAADLVSEPRVQARAKERLTALSAMELKSKGIRMDSVYYMVGALEIFNEITGDHLRVVTSEIALKGQNGFDISNVGRKYTLDSLPGEFTGLQLVSYLYVGCQMINTVVDLSIDLGEEYVMAVKLYQSEDIH